MTDAIEVRRIADQLIKTLVSNHPAEAAEVSSLILSQVLGAGLHGPDSDDVATGAFVREINDRLVTLAQYYGSTRVPASRRRTV